MRAVILGLASLVIAGEAFAADYPDYLRGSSYESAPVGYDWSGTYVGLQTGYSGTDYNFSKATQPLVADMLRQLTIENEAHVSTWPNLPPGDSRAASFGGFVGYNSQWGDAVVGVELNYNRINNSASTSTDVIGRAYTTTDSFLYNVNVISNASARLADLATLRLRAGYAWGWVMPYAMFGVAVGRVDASRSATVFLTSTDVSATALDLTDGIAPRPGGSLSVTRTETKTGAIAIGYTAGVGVDIGLMPGVFVRGEWEFAQLNKVLGIPVTVNSFRFGAAVKF